MGVGVCVVFGCLNPTTVCTMCDWINHVCPLPEGCACACVCARYDVYDNDMTCVCVCVWFAAYQ